jgi:hypothetical protein
MPERMKGPCDRDLPTPAHPPMQELVISVTECKAAILTFRSLFNQPHRGVDNGFSDNNTTEPAVNKVICVEGNSAPNDERVVAACE